MKVKEIISEGLGFGDGFGSGYDEDYSKNREDGRRHKEMSDDFQNDRTPLSNFDMADIKKIVMPAARSKGEVKRQVEDVISTWEELLDGDSYVEDDVFNKVFQQFEKLKDSEESPLIKFNKMHALTKEIKDAAANFDEESSGEYGDKFNDSKGYF